MTKQFQDPSHYKPSSDSITFLPLGGCGQFGANFNLYGHAKQWIAIDCGMAFADERLPGVDIMLPDPAFIADQKDALQALIITHAHEDHIGAVARVWPKLGCPIYASPFAQSVLKRKFAEYPPEDGVMPQFVTLTANKQFDCGSFTITPIPVAHSIPEAYALALTTDIGTVLHSGDWNLDPKPIVGNPTSEDHFKTLGDKGIMAYIGDSTNAPVDGFSKSESEIAPAFETLFASCKKRIAVTLFSSNISRIINIHRAATANGRKICLVGRSLCAMAESARECGYIGQDIQFLSDDDAKDIAADKIVYIVTGSQGEGRAALSKIATGTHRHVKLGKGDAVFFSARSIPGNERRIIDIKNLLVAGGVRVFDPESVTETIHVSGHPRHGEIQKMLEWTRPKALIAIHGERIQQGAQALMHENAIAPENGQIINIAPDGTLKTMGYVETALQVVDFDRIVDLDHAAVAMRRKMSFNGAVMVSLVFDIVDDDILDLQISAPGLFDMDHAHDRENFKDLEDMMDQAILKMPQKSRHNPDELEKKITSYAKRYFRELFSVRPLVEVHVTLLD